MVGELLPAGSAVWVQKEPGTWSKAVVKQVLREAHGALVVVTEDGAELQAEEGLLQNKDEAEVRRCGVLQARNVLSFRQLTGPAAVAVTSCGSLAAAVVSELPPGGVLNSTATIHII